MKNKQNAKMEKESFALVIFWIEYEELVDTVREHKNTSVEPSHYHANHATNGGLEFSCLTEAPHKLCGNISYIVQEHDYSSYKCHIEHVAEGAEKQSYQVVEHHFHVVGADMVEELLNQNMQIITD